MKRFLLLAMAVLFSVTASNCKGTGDVGSVECREVQLAVQSTVSDGEPYKNHWEMMKTVNHLLSEEIKIGKITLRCAACIKQQFAQGIAIDEQKPCGEDAAAQTVLNFATNEFSKMREKIDLEDKTPANAKFIGNHVEVASQKWAYVLDYSGQQIFRPINAYSHLKASFLKDISRVVEEWKDANVPQSKIDEARLLTSKTLGVDYEKNRPAKVFSARELIASKSIESEAIKHYEGRTIVHFSPVLPDDVMVRQYRTQMTASAKEGPSPEVELIDMPPKSYETAITFAPGGEVMRVESTFMSDELRGIVKVFSAGLASGSIKGQLYAYDDLMFGTFFEDNEWRFEMSAYTWESVGFLPLPGDQLSDTCTNVPIPSCGDDKSFQQLQPTDDYKKNMAYWWCNSGRYNGFRGNCLSFDEATQSCQSWQVEDRRIVKHKNLRDYQLKCSAGPAMCWPSDTNIIEHCDGIKVSYPKGGFYRLEDKFYTDLEQCHAAMIYAHGGDAFCGGFYQFQKQRDIWVSLHREGDDGLGKGNLRHLFLAACSSINWNHGMKHGEYQNLFSDWMNGHVADGIRTICGTDGSYAGTESDGFRFFQYYHQGDTISQAWFNMELNINSENVPVVVAYGKTEEEAAATLFNGRFTKERAGTGWVVAAELITDHLQTHQACCLTEPDSGANSICIDTSTSACTARSGISQGENTHCADHCPYYPYPLCF